MLCCLGQWVVHLCSSWRSKSLEHTMGLLAYWLLQIFAWKTERSSLEGRLLFSIFSIFTQIDRLSSKYENAISIKFRFHVHADKTKSIPVHFTLNWRIIAAVTLDTPLPKAGMEIISYLHVRNRWKWCRITIYQAFSTFAAADRFFALVRRITLRIL